MYPTKVTVTPAKKNTNPLSKQEVREMGEIVQVEDIRACIKAEREKTQQKKSTNTLQSQKGRCDAGCGGTRELLAQGEPRGLQ